MNILDKKKTSDHCNHNPIYKNIFIYKNILDKQKRPITVITIQFMKILRDFCYETLPTMFENVKLILSGSFTSLGVFIVYEVKYSYQFCYLIKRCLDDI